MWYFDSSSSRNFLRRSILITRNILNTRNIRTILPVLAALAVCAHTNVCKCEFAFTGVLGRARLCWYSFVQYGAMWCSVVLCWNTKRAVPELDRVCCCWSLPMRSKQTTTKASMCPCTCCSLNLTHCHTHPRARARTHR
jgi:hypothetical protein